MENPAMKRSECLILIAGGLIAHVTAIFQEMQILPVFIKEVWNTNSIINEDGFLGRILHAFIGYDGNPTLIEITAYTSYIVLFSIRFAKIIKENQRNKPQQFQPQTSNVKETFAMFDTDRVIFDRTGKWGLYGSVEEFGLLGGEPEFMARYIERAGGFEFIREKADVYWQGEIEEDGFEASHVPHYYELAGWDNPPRKSETAK